MPIFARSLRGFAVLSALLFGAAQARAQQPPSGSGEPAPAAATAPSEAVEPVPAPETVTAPEAAAAPHTPAPETPAPEAAPAPPAEADELAVDEPLSADEIHAQAEATQLATLRAKMTELEREEADTSTVLPWTALIVGVVATVVGLAVGVERVVSCERSCNAPFWPGWVVVGGTTVGTAGVLWLKLAHEDLAELRSRHYQLQTQLDAFELNRAPSPASGALAPMLRMGARF